MKRLKRLSNYEAYRILHSENQKFTLKESEKIKHTLSNFSTLIFKACRKKQNENSNII